MNFKDLIDQLKDNGMVICIFLGNFSLILLLEQEKRDNSLKILSAAISRLSADRQLILDIWDGLFYCKSIQGFYLRLFSHLVGLWMSDKPKYQQDLAQKFSSFISEFNDSASSLVFIECFWDTMSRNWRSLDYHRLDKFYFLIRQFLHDTFHFLNSMHWDQLESFVEIINNSIFK